MSYPVRELYLEIYDMQRDTAELIEFWKKRFNIDLPNEKFNLYKIEHIAYNYKVSDIIRLATKLNESNIFAIITHLDPRENCITFDWNDKIESIYGWIVTYFYPQHMSWTDFTILIELGIKYSVNLVCGTAQKLINEQKPLSLQYLRRVIESTVNQDNTRKAIEEQIINMRMLDIRDNTQKQSIDTSDLLDQFRDTIDEI